MTKRTNFFYLYTVIILISILLSYFLFLLKPVSLLATAKELAIVIERGQDFTAIADELADAGLIRSRVVFKIYAIMSLAALNFKAGAYAFSPALSTPEIIAKLFRGPGEDVEVTIIEGRTTAEIDDQLSAAGIINSGALIGIKPDVFQREFDFLTGTKSLEGFLLPDTYRFYTDSPAETVARRFLENFRKKAWPLINQKSIRQLADKNQNELSDYEILILASLIEKEVPFHNDRLIVSGILRKRLALEMPLQVDAAPVTYQRQGLPEGPIANPGLDAVFTAANPKSSPYLYYLSDPKTKKTIFAEDFEQHKENKWRYLKK